MQHMANDLEYTPTVRSSLESDLRWKLNADKSDTGNSKDHIEMKYRSWRKEDGLISSDWEIQHANRCLMQEVYQTKSHLSTTRPAQSLRTQYINNTNILQN